jgi:predicted AAA+ superfamily ATPase
MFDETDKGSGIIAITGFRGLGKTVLMGVVYPIWRIIKGERYVIHTAADIDSGTGTHCFHLA